MPKVLRGLNASWDSDTLMAVNIVPVGVEVASIGAAVPNTTVQSSVLIPFNYKIRKVAVMLTAIDDVIGSDAFNLVVGGLQGQTGQTYTQGNIAGNDNSQTGPPPGGLGYPSNIATAGQSVFTADVPFNASNTPVNGSGWISLTTSGGYGIFVPPNYDAVYPGNIPLSLRVSTVAISGSISNLAVSVSIVPIPLRRGPTPGEQNFPVPQVDY